MPAADKPAPPPPSNGGSNVKLVGFINGALYVAVVVGLVVALVLAGDNVAGQRKTAGLIRTAKDLSQELRQSSDDLTRFIRTYTVTGNASYWDFFNRVIRIRDGDEGLPTQPHRNYWDLYIPSGEDPRPIGAPSSFLSRVAAAEFTDSEIALLDEAKANSDALIDLEGVAYNAMQGRYRPNNTVGLSVEQAKEFSVYGAPNQTLAQQLTHSLEYHAEKGKIMRPIDDFAHLSTVRILQQLEELQNQGITILAVLSAMLILLIVLVLFYVFKVAKDTQTQQILSTMLPSRVAASLTVSDFNDLRHTAKQASNKRRGTQSSRMVPVDHDGAPGRIGMPLGAMFPTLYSESIPIGWISFCDVVDFTSMCRLTDSKTIISLLNELFSLMDCEAANFGVEKIKTIGDAFMSAKLPMQGRRTDSDGLEMLQFLLRAVELAGSVVKPRIARGESTETHLKIRVGLNVGPMSAGIVGFERPLYDLFGDTVNTAARLESSGVASAIHIQETTVPYFGRFVNHLQFSEETDDFDEGKVTRSVTLKGIGQVDTKLIVGCGCATLSNNGTILTDLEMGASSTDIHAINGEGSTPPKHPRVNKEQDGVPDDEDGEDPKALIEVEEAEEETIHVPPSTLAPP